MYQFKLGQIGKTSDSGGNWSSAIALCIALFLLPLVLFTEGQLLPISNTSWLAIIS